MWVWMTSICARPVFNDGIREYTPVAFPLFGMAGSWADPGFICDVLVLFLRGPKLPNFSLFPIRTVIRLTFAWSQSVCLDVSLSAIKET